MSEVSGPDAGAGPVLRKVTINLTPAAVDALDLLAAGQRTSRTDAINRALRVAAVLHEIAPDGRLRVRRPGGGVVEVILI